MSNIRKVYGIDFYGKISRKWQLPDGQVKFSETCPGEDWEQVPMSMWDVDGHTVLEIEPMLREVK